MQRPPIDLRALCVIARRLLTDDPTMDDSEWRERLKCQLLAQGWTYPRNPALIGEAMTRVERDRPRPIPTIPTSATRAPARRAPELRTAGPRIDRPWISLAELIDGIKKRRSKRHDAA